MMQAMSGLVSMSVCERSSILSTIECALVRKIVGRNFGKVIVVVVGVIWRVWLELLLLWLLACCVSVELLMVDIMSVAEVKILRG